MLTTRTTGRSIGSSSLPSASFIHSCHPTTRAEVAGLPSGNPTFHRCTRTHDQARNPDELCRYRPSSDKTARVRAHTSIDPERTRGHHSHRSSDSCRPHKDWEAHRRKEHPCNLHPFDNHSCGSSRKLARASERFGSTRPSCSSCIPPACHESAASFLHRSVVDKIADGRPRVRRSARDQKLTVSRSRSRSRSWSSRPRARSASVPFHTERRSRRKRAMRWRRRREQRARSGAYRVLAPAPM
jgi:hypothetical protein